MFSSPEGGTAILPVILGMTLDPNDLAVEWRHGEKFVHMFLDGWDYLKNQDLQYKGRTSLFEDEFSRGNVSLKLMNVTVEDAGTYSLSLRGSNISADQRKHSVSLCVDRKEEGHQAGTPEPGDKVWVQILAIIVVLAVLVGLVGSIFLVLRRRRRKRMDHQEGTCNGFEELEKPKYDHANTDWTTDEAE